MHLLIDTTLDAQGFAWDANKDLCLEIAQLYRSHLRKSWMDQLDLENLPIFWDPRNSNAIFVSGLMLIARECRDNVVRQEVMDTCKAILDAPGGWNMKSLVMATAILVKVEEGHRDKSGEIPMSSRYDVKEASVRANILHPR
jgi:hypothetical protein